MKTNMINAFICCMAFYTLSGTASDLQAQGVELFENQIAKVDSLPVGDSQELKTWTLFGEDGSVQLSEETIQLLTDDEYRSAKYPAVYDIHRIPDLLQSGDIPFTLWTMVNVYEENPQQVRTIAFMLTEQGIQGKHYLNAFYTYGLADPEIFHFVSGEDPFLENPLRMEEKLESCRTLAAYTDHFLKSRNEGK